MSSVEELKSALKENLEARGVLRELRAHLRAEIYEALDQPGGQRPELSNANLLINELVRDYLEFNGYTSAASVLAAESGQPPAARMQRAFLAQEFNIREQPECSGLPLIYSLLAYFINRRSANRRLLFADPNEASAQPDDQA